MAKDRNTLAKRQREADKKRKAREKRERRDRKKQSAGGTDESGDADSDFSDTERAVFGVFRKYLMGPGNMLCFSGSDLDNFSGALAGLAERGYVVSERFRGGFSLTKRGFLAMKDCA